MFHEPHWGLETQWWALPLHSFPSVHFRHTIKLAMITRKGSDSLTGVPARIPHHIPHGQGSSPEEVTLSLGPGWVRGHLHLWPFWRHTADDQRTGSVSAHSPASSCTFLRYCVPAELGDLPITAHMHCCAYTIPLPKMQLFPPPTSCGFLLLQLLIWNLPLQRQALSHPIISLAPFSSLGDFKARILSPITYILELSDVRKVCKGLTWWSSGKESAGQCRRHRLNPWLRKIPHAVEQVSPCSRARELQLLSPRPCSLCSTRREAVAVRSPCTPTREQLPLAATRESPRTAMETQCSQK